jgi:hypothetical protein
VAGAGSLAMITVVADRTAACRHVEVSFDLPHARVEATAENDEGIRSVRQSKLAVIVGVRVALLGK